MANLWLIALTIPLTLLALLGKLLFLRRLRDEEPTLAPRPTSGFYCLKEETCSEDEIEGCYNFGLNGGVVGYGTVDFLTTFDFSFIFRFPNGLTSEILLKSSSARVEDLNVPIALLGISNKNFEPYADGRPYNLRLTYNHTSTRITIVVNNGTHDEELINDPTDGNIPIVVGDYQTSIGMGANQTQLACIYNDSYVERL